MYLLFWCNLFVAYAADFELHTAVILLDVLDGGVGVEVGVFEDEAYATRSHIEPDVLHVVGVVVGIVIG